MWGEIDSLLDRKSAIEYSGEAGKKDEAEGLAEHARRLPG